MGRTPLTRKQKRTEEFKSASRESNGRAKHIEPGNGLHKEVSPQAFKNNAIQVKISERMVRTKKKELTRKINKSKESKSASRKSNARAEHIESDNDFHNEDNSQAFENSAIQSEVNSENNDARNEENSQAFEDNEMQLEGNYEAATEIKRREVVDSNPTVKKITRGPTKLKRFTSFPFGQIEVEFNQEGEPIGPGSVKLSSYLGPLVQEHVPVTLKNWRSLGDDLKAVLWESIQAIFNLDEEWQKVSIFQKMECIWRGSKCRLVRQKGKAKTKKERLELKPANIKSKEWKEFIKLKTSLNFKARSEIFKRMRYNQMPHTCGRKGMARLAEELREQSDDPFSISRAQVWIKSCIRKNGQPVSITVADTIEKIKKIESEPQSSLTTNVKGDALSQVLVRSRTMEKSKDKQVVLLQNRISKLEDMLLMLVENPGKESWREESTSKTSKHVLSPDKCDLLDWSGTDEIVAEGRVGSSDPNELVHKIPLGLNAMKILIDYPRKADAYLWRPTPSLTHIGEAEDEIVAWPANRVVMRFTKHPKEKDNVSKTSRICKLYDWSGSESLVAEGRLHSSDPKELVNGIPLGPSSVIVWVDNPIKGDAFLWRPIAGMTWVAEAAGSKIAWPESKVVVEKVKTATSAPTSNAAASPAPTFNAAASPAPTVNSASYRMSANSMVKNKCKLIDLCGTGEVVAEGRAIDPNAFALGENAVKVSVDVVKVPNALLWRPSWTFKYIEDVVGNIIPWPAANVIMESNHTAAVDKGSRSKKPKNDASPAVDKGSRSKKPKNNTCKAINELIQVINTCHE